MKTVKRFAALALALVLVAALVPATAHAGGVRVLDSGLAGTKKLSVQEIAQLFAGETTVDAENLYERAPDLERRPMRTRARPHRRISTRRWSGSTTCARWPALAA